ncbi:MAG: VWA domain-containing protein [Bacteroidetes bacterium]|nr:VWA domain-containing protein [Bacteroidota bacterium]
MELFRFANPENLYFLLVLPFIAATAAYSFYRSARALKMIGDKELVDGLIPERSASRPVVKLIFVSVSIVLIVIALARPQYGSRIEEVKKKGIEIIIALDVSNSMLAADIKPNRLERSKQAIERMVEQFTDDRVGLIVFAGDAYMQLPVTADYTSAKMFLATIGPDIVPKQGTAIGAAINLGIRSFSPSNTESKAIIIITDGENHEDDPVQMAIEAAKNNVVVYTVGIGSPEGAPIPVEAGGRTEFLKDRDGNTVISRLDERALQEIAGRTGGKYIRAGAAGMGLTEIYADISGIKKTESAGKVFAEYNDQFQYFAGAALLLLLAELLIMDRKNRRFLNMKIFRVKI